MYTCVIAPNILLQPVCLSPLLAYELLEDRAKVCMLFAFPGTRMVPRVKRYLIDGSVSEQEDLWEPKLGGRLGYEKKALDSAEHDKESQVMECSKSI